ncbi:MAG: AI-2E family transporter [Bacillota bacterium]|nr:AI-2E family transporter [Bacillota bacterium]
MSRSTWQVILLLVGAGALVWLLYAVRGVLLPFGAALFLVYLTEPLIVRMEQRQAPRVVAILAVYAMLFGLVWVAVAYFWPIVAGEAERALANLPTRTAELRRLAERLVAMGRNRRLPAHVAAVLTVLAEETQRTVAQLGRRAVSLTLSLFSRMALLLLAPVISFYLSRDLPALRRGLLKLFPPSGRGEARQLLSQVNAVLGGYVRGQLVISSFVGLAVWLGLALLGIPYAALIGVIAGLFDVIPYFGPVIGAVPAVLLALGRSAWTAVTVVLLFVAIHQFEGLILVPRIMGSRVGLHPVVVIFVLLAGGHLFGLGGMLLGVPVAAVARVVLRFGLRRWLGGGEDGQGEQPPARGVVEEKKQPEPLPEDGSR